MTTEAKDKINEIAGDWFKLASKYDCDVFVAFYVRWVAFNCLYNFSNKKKEYERINAFCEENYASLKKVRAFSVKDFSVFLDKSIERMPNSIKVKHNERTYNELKSYRDGYNNDDDIELTALKNIFQTMYYVRCNLFHGGKSRDVERDKRLVKLSSVLLNRYLTEYFSSQ